MTKRNVHVVPSGKGWVIRVAGSTDPVGTPHRRRVTAVKEAEGLARQYHSDTKIHQRDGKIYAGNCYGNDPFPPKDFRGQGYLDRGRGNASTLRNT